MAARDYVIQQYRELLGRDPDAGGLRHYMGYSNPGEVRSSILGSDEYRNRSQQSAAPAQNSAIQQAAAERAALEAQVGGLFGELGGLYQNMQNPVEVYNKALESLGISDARTRVTSLRQQLMNTENLLQNVEADVTGRTSGSLVTEGQRRRLVAGEQAPLASQVDVYGRALEGALGDYGMILGEGKTQAELQFQGEREKRQALMDRIEIAISRSNSAEDKRRWETELDRLRKQDAEAVRQFNASHALEQQKLAQSNKSGGGGGGSSGSSKAGAQKQVIDYINSQGVKGSDGYISPVTYKQLRSEWVAAGYSGSAFDSNFRTYANPDHLWDYGLK